MWVSFVFINSFSKNVFLNKKAKVKIDSHASAGSHGMYMKYASFPWPPFVTWNCCKTLARGLRNRGDYFLQKNLFITRIQLGLLNPTITFKLCSRPFPIKFAFGMRVSKLKDSGLHVMQCIHHRLFPPSPMASSMWYIPDHLHLTTSLLLHCWASTAHRKW
jgi:hypothetical protein